MKEARRFGVALYPTVPTKAVSRRSSYLQEHLDNENETNLGGTTFFERPFRRADSI
jgi:hypothetical protein